MSATVSIFFLRDASGFSEPGTCPRCKRVVNVGGKGNPKAHKCGHLAWCKQCPKCNPKEDRK